LKGSPANDIFKAAICALIFHSELSLSAMSRHYRYYKCSYQLSDIKSLFCRLNRVQNETILEPSFIESGHTAFLKKHVKQDYKTTSQQKGPHETLALSVLLNVAFSAK